MRTCHVDLLYRIDSSLFIFCLLVKMNNMKNMYMDNMDNIALYFCGIYLLLNESAGYGNCMFHAVGASDVVIGESSHHSLRVNLITQIMEMYTDDPFLL